MNLIQRWFERKRVDRDLAAEMAAHVEEKIEDLVEQGMSAEEAPSTVRKQFGNVTLQRENSREAWGWNGLEQFAKDLRFACRLLAKTPGFTVTALLTLALGIGASTAVFTLVESVILKPMNYRNSGELVVAWERVRFLFADPVGPNPKHVDFWRRHATPFSGLALLRRGEPGVILGTEHPRLIGAVISSTNLFGVLQVDPILGRGFRLEDGVKGRDNVAILTYSLWQDLFRGDPDVIGKTFRVNEIPCQIIGVLPENFSFPNANALRSFGSKQANSNIRVPESALFLPAVINPNDFDWHSDYGNWITLGRLKPNVSLGQANAQLASLEARVLAQIPANYGDHTPGSLQAFVQPMQEVIVGDSKTGLWLLMAAVTGLMLIACLNLANAQLGRAVVRRREAALRSALGASQWRLLISAFAENLLLAGTGGLAGIVLAMGALNLLRLYSPVDLPRLSEVHLNLTVLVFSLAVTLGSCIFFGIAPTLRLMHTDPQTALQQNNGRTIGNRQSHRLRVWLIGMQVFGCTALLLVTGLFSKSLLHLLHQDKGFETAHVALAAAYVPERTYKTAESRIAFNDAVLRRLRAIPGVESAALVSSMPLEGESWVEGLHRTDKPHQKTPLINLRWVSPGYFETIREKLIAGRFFEERDRNLHSIVLSEGEARTLWPQGSAIGGLVSTEGGKFTVIGVVADARTTSLKSAPANTAYAHYTDRPSVNLVFLARGKRSADLLLPSMRQAIWSQAPDVTIARLKTLDAQLADSLATERFQTFVLLSFAASALLLAMLGIYGVLNYAMVSRRQEIGVRIALGATRGQIYALIFSEGGSAVLGGLAAGLFASVLAARLIQKLLYGVRAMDPPVVAAVLILFLAAALAAAYLPARRAASVDPMDALRAE
jgi:predicted permease